MVVVHHAQHYFGDAAQDWSTFGSRGVDLFFIISGFIMAFVTRSYAADLPRWPQIRDFLLRRLLRIAPLYWLALLLTARYLIVEGDIDLGLVMDFLFLPHWSGEPGGLPSPILVPGWTINYEMFFYAVFAACMFAGTARYLLLFTLFAVLMVLGMTIEGQSAFWVFYTNFILSEFLLGILLFHFVSRSRHLPPPWVAAVAMLVGWAGLYVANDIVANHYFFGITCVFIVWGTLHLLQGVKSKVMLLVGDASYSIYLFHSFVLEYGFRLFRKTGLVEPEPLTIITVFTGLVLIVIVFSILLHLWVEKPLLAWGQRLISGMKSRSQISSGLTQKG